MRQTSIGPGTARAVALLGLLALTLIGTALLVQRPWTSCGSDWSDAPRVHLSSSGAYECSTVESSRSEPRAARLHARFVHRRWTRRRSPPSLTSRRHLRVLSRRLCEPCSLFSRDQRKRGLGTKSHYPRDTNHGRWISSRGAVAYAQ